MVGSGKSETPPRPARSIRFRLLAIALLPTLVILPLLLGIAISRWNTKFDALLITKVNGDLTIAHQYLQRILENTGEHIQALAVSAAFRDAVDAGQKQRLADFLEDSRRRLHLDFLALVEDQEHPAVHDTGNETWPVVVAALNGTSSTSIDIFSSEQLAGIAPYLAGRAQIDLVETTNAASTSRARETRGMMIHSASPAMLSGGRKTALVGGILLNQNLVFIDTINDLVYRQASLPEGSSGTATLFLEDVRISTNVRLFENRRALGTRVSGAVRAAVLDQGRTWLDSAFVVNDWYISAYEPIVDSFGRRVGMLYVGFLERPFRQAKYTTLLTIILAFLVVTALSVPIFLRWARAIFKPLERMSDTITRVESGNMDARTQLKAANDEIGRVALHLDSLLDQLQIRDRALRQWNDELNDRVTERTSELELANRQIEATTKQLIMSEKLAAIGEITAGVAHEINNPIAVIQGNLDVVRSVLGRQADEAKVEFRLIDEQIHRISQIVTRLLQFAKPEEYAGYIERHAPADVISDCLPLVQHLLHKSKIALVRDDRATRRVLMNRIELQQVAVNLTVNAIHAMPNGGTLTIRTFDHDMPGTSMPAPDMETRPGVKIEITDTGMGMTPELLTRIFDPFFTTKRQEGTGLGLSISQRLIARQDGRMSVESKPGAGTCFSIWLPEAD